MKVKVIKCLILNFDYWGIRQGMVALYGIQCCICSKSDNKMADGCTTRTLDIKLDLCIMPFWISAFAFLGT